jgi:hypothetical protein
MFADFVYKNDSSAQPIIVEIRNLVGKYLTKILEQGKQTKVFSYNVDTKLEVESILNRFRFFMSDIPMTHKMIRDLKTLRENGD